MLVFLAPIRANSEATNALVINGAPISIAEYHRQIEHERTAVIQLFNDTHNLEFGPAFWDHREGGTTPRKMLQRKTTERLVREKVQQLLFQELGLLTNISHAAFLEYHTNLNRALTAAVQQGRVVYGPTNFTAHQLYGHWMESLKLQAKQRLSAERLHATDKELRSFYARTKTTYRMPDVASWEVTTFRSGTDRGKSVELSVREALARLNSGGSVGELASTNSRPESSVSHQHYENLDNDRLSEVFADEKVFTKVRLLKPGPAIPLALADGSWVVVKCLSRTSGKIRPYEVVQERVRARLLDQSYERPVDELARKARVEVNQQVLDALPIE